jgi:hypothetical protein
MSLGRTFVGNWIDIVTAGTMSLTPPNVKPDFAEGVHAVCGRQPESMFSPIL